MNEKWTKCEMHIAYWLKRDSRIHELGHIADNYWENETAKEPGESNLKAEKGDLKGNYPVKTDEGPGRKIGDQRSNICSCFKQGRDNGKLYKRTARGDSAQAGAD